MNTRHRQNDMQALDRFGYKITARLSSAADALAPDISERLRAARVRAVDKRKWVLLQSAPEIFAYGRSGTASAGGGGLHGHWWSRLGMASLLLTLVLGLFTIDVIQDELGSSELAEIDTAILTDDLPPSAYIDPGFAQFLRSTNRSEQ
jgi:hypothetical protein